MLRANGIAQQLICCFQLMFHPFKSFPQLPCRLQVQIADTRVFLMDLVHGFGQIIQVSHKLHRHSLAVRVHRHKSRIPVICRSQMRQAVRQRHQLSSHIRHLILSGKAPRHDRKGIVRNTLHHTLHIGIRHNVLLSGGARQFSAHALRHTLNFLFLLPELLAVFVIVGVQALHALFHLPANLFLHLLAHALLFRSHLAVHKAIHDPLANLFRRFPLHARIALHLLRPQLIYEICDRVHPIAIVGICLKFSGVRFAQLPPKRIDGHTVLGAHADLVSGVTAKLPQAAPPVQDTLHLAVRDPDHLPCQALVSIAIGVHQLCIGAALRPCRLHQLSADLACPANGLFHGNVFAFHVGIQPDQLFLQPGTVCAAVIFTLQRPRYAVCAPVQHLLPGRALALLRVAQNCPAFIFNGFHHAHGFLGNVLFHKQCPQHAVPVFSGLGRTSKAPSADLLPAHGAFVFLLSNSEFCTRIKIDIFLTLR